MSGACSASGSCSVAGVYSTHGSKWNVSERLGGSEHTRESAELEAYMLALKTSGRMGHIYDSDVLIHQVIIKTDSEYLVQSLGEDILQWKRNG